MRTTAAIITAFTLARAASAGFAGCYDPAPLDIEFSSNVSSIAECSTSCAGSTVALFGNGECGCTDASLPTNALRTAEVASDGDEPDMPSCPDGTLTANLLDTDYTFASCSYAASTTAQFASTANSTTECFAPCAGYQAVFAFPTLSGWNCYCAFTGTGAGRTDCSDNTFYEYALEAAEEEAESQSQPEEAEPAQEREVRRSTREVRQETRRSRL